jgi:hypothetical protein
MVKDATSSAMLGTATTTTGGAFSGSVTIKSPSRMVNFSTTGISGYQDSTTSFTLYCGSNAVGDLSPMPNVNHAPTINSIGNQTYCGLGSQTVNLSGISDGDGGTQTITITATSSNTSQIPNPSVTYTSPNTTGSLTINPNSAALNNCATPVTISVKITDSGGISCGGTDHVVKTFTVSLVDPATTPTLNPIANVGPILAGSLNQTVSLSGIGGGICHTTGAALSVSAASSAPSVSSVLSVSYTPNNSTGSVVVSIGSPGTATITVAVSDSNAGRCGSNNVKTQTFTVTVV